MSYQMENINDATTKAPAEQHGVRYVSPLCDVIEGKESVVVLADIPHCNEQSVELEVEKNTLTITATPAEQKAISRGERYGYRKMFQLSEGVDRERIEASVKDGVLKIVLPKSAQHQPRKIQVKAS